MKDFREVSTMELFFKETTKMELKMRKFEELFKKNMLKLTLKGDDKKSEDLEQDDEVKAKQKVKNLAFADLKKEADE